MGSSLSQGQGQGQHVVCPNRIPGRLTLTSEDVIPTSPISLLQVRCASDPCNRVAASWIAGTVNTVLLGSASQFNDAYMPLGGHPSDLVVQGSTVQSGYTVQDMGVSTHKACLEPAVSSCQTMPTYADAMQPPGRTVRGLVTTTPVTCGSLL